jgi:tetratricopeptide (TPR) repeat protein
LDKALEIKRRAQRAIQSGDLDGAMEEYEKLVALPDCDPYNFVLLADLLYKRGDQSGAVQRYLSASDAYEKSGLYKNAIAVCKKMMRLALSPAQVLDRLAHLHALDGLATEAALYHQQFAELLMREQRPTEAAAALRKAYEIAPEELPLLERIAEVLLLADDKAGAGLALAEAAFQHQKRGHADVALALKRRAEDLKSGSVREYEVQALGASHASPEVSAPEPSAPADDDDDVPAMPGPPLLPSLRGEPEVIAEESEVERFPSAGAAARSSAQNGQGDSEESRKTVLLSAGEIEGMLHLAQEKLRAGESEQASTLLVEAAQAYEAVGRHENAGTIYRSLGKSPSSPAVVLELWLANCERRQDQREAAAVACELGDRSIQQGNVDSAHLWFERARKLDENNLLAQRRLQRLEAMKDGYGPPQLVSNEAAAAPALEPIAAPAPPVAPAPVAPPADFAPAPAEVAPVAAEPSILSAPPMAPAPMPAPPAPEPVTMQAPPAAPPAETPTSRVELAVGRSEAVTFDLGALLSEFQRGIEAQLSGDAQGHYDLAMAYREMGLLDHAVESFRMALANPALAHRAAEMLGRCMLDQGRFDEAAAELQSALEQPGLDAEGVLGLRYLLGLAYEAAGRPREALAELERVFAEQPNYHDVAPKLRDLRKALGTP